MKFLVLNLSKAAVDGRWRRAEFCHDLRNRILMMQAVVYHASGFAQSKMELVPCYRRGKDLQLPPPIYLSIDFPLYHGLLPASSSLNEDTSSRRAESPHIERPRNPISYTIPLSVQSNHGNQRAAQTAPLFPSIRS